MFGGNSVESLGGGDDQRFDWPSGNFRGRRILWQCREGLVDALHAFNINRQTVEKYARQRMAGDLRQRGMASNFLPLVVLAFSAGADDQDTLSSKVDGW
jgi:hypothetical protein